MRGESQCSKHRMLQHILEAGQSTCYCWWQVAKDVCELSVWPPLIIIYYDFFNLLYLSIFISPCSVQHALWAKSDFRAAQALRRGPQFSHLWQHALFKTSVQHPLYMWLFRPLEVHVWARPSYTYSWSCPYRESLCATQIFFTKPVWWVSYHICTIVVLYKIPQPPHKYTSSRM